MKDLLADLQVDDGDFSLDQLEKELATLDQDPLQLQTQSILPMDAASLVVSHAQERATAMPTGAPLPNQGFDAWSLSLQNFTAMSLQEDFLAADSARRKQHGTPQALQSILVEGAEEYDIGEKAILTPPPGLGVPPVGFTSEPPEPFPFPKTPQNSVNFGVEESAKLKDALRDALGVRQAQKSSSLAPPVSSSQGTLTETIPEVTVPSHEAAFIPGPPSGVAPGVDAVLPPQPLIPPHTMPPPPEMVVNPPPHMTSQHISMAPVVVVPPPVRGPVWQTPPPPVPQPILPVVYCNPHPAAPPIPATALESKCMSARDIAYVVHSILKPVLAAGISEDDYYIQFLRRLGGQANPNNPKKPKDMEEEMLSRANKSKEWSSEKGVLGHVAKSNVARPRALIASPLVPTSSEQDSEQKQRATLWKARIYCDQGYQAYETVVDIWRAAPPGGVPPQVQMHLVKLMKCMGITHVDKEYQLDRASLTLLLKLSKGRTLTARVLEQALLPPNAVQALLPLLLDVLLSTAAGKKGHDDNNSFPSSDDFSVERLFRAVAGVIQKLNTTSETLLQCLDVVQRNGKNSLESPARMECAHTLLQKGSIVIAHDPSEEKRVAWGKAEGEFMNILQAF